MSGGGLRSCQAEFAPALQLHAKAEPGSVFLGWLGDANCLSGAPLLDRDTVCVALFDDDPDLLLLDGFERPAMR